MVMYRICFWQYKLELEGPRTMFLMRLNHKYIWNSGHTSTMEQMVVVTLRRFMAPLSSRRVSLQRVHLPLLQHQRWRPTNANIDTNTNKWEYIKQRNIYTWVSNQSTSVAPTPMLTAKINTNTKKWNTLRRKFIYISLQWIEDWECAFYQFL